MPIPHDTAALSVRYANTLSPEALDLNFIYVTWCQFLNGQSTVLPKIGAICNRIIDFSTSFLQVFWAARWRRKWRTAIVRIAVLSADCCCILQGNRLRNDFNRSNWCTSVVCFMSAQEGFHRFLIIHLQQPRQVAKLCFENGGVAIGRVAMHSIAFFPYFTLIWGSELKQTINGMCWNCFVMIVHSDDRTDLKKSLSAAATVIESDAAVSDSVRLRLNLLKNSWTL